MKLYNYTSIKIITCIEIKKGLAWFKSDEKQRGIIIINK